MSCSNFVSGTMEVVYVERLEEIMRKDRPSFGSIILNYLNESCDEGEANDSVFKVQMGYKIIV